MFMYIYIHTYKRRDSSPAKPDAVQWSILKLWTLPRPFRQDATPPNRRASDLFQIVHSCCCCLLLCVLIPVGRWWWWVFNGRRWANLNYVWFYFLLLLLLQRNWLWFRLGQSGANLRSICPSSHSLDVDFSLIRYQKKLSLFGKSFINVVCAAKGK